jgi:hypothetical protein
VNVKVDLAGRDVQSAHVNGLYCIGCGNS